MRRSDAQRGYSVLEVLVALVVLMSAMAGTYGLLLQSSRVNKRQQLTASAQSDARTCLAMVVAKLRSAGWDPSVAGIQVVQTDTNLGDNVSEIEIFADLDADGDTDGLDEQVMIRHSVDRIEWRRSASGSFEILAVGISNDADGNGTPEPMFNPDSTPNPTSVMVQITAEAPAPDPISGLPIRYTVSSEVVLRRTL
jgi:type II secretory pathway pseudopilin PulG